MSPEPRSGLPSHDGVAEMTAVGRTLVIVCVFLGWFFAGVQMGITTLAMRPAAIDLLSDTGMLTALEMSANQSGQDPGRVKAWIAWYTCAFLFGAAAGGFLLGRLGDRLGRVRGMALSILCYTAFSGLAWYARSPHELLALRFLACLGVGGMWPNGVALVAEAFPNFSRPMMAGVIGTSANVGIWLFSILAMQHHITVDDWRWTMLLGAAPLPLALFVLASVPESPRWLARRREQAADAAARLPASEVFRPPLLGVTIIGILLGTVPLMGGWGSANWMPQWADEAGMDAVPPDPGLKAQVQAARAFTGMIGSLIGGWVASLVGRRLAYFLASVGALGSAQYAFWALWPTDPSFMFWCGALGFFNGLYFGWLPLFLPELFPTRARSTGAGVSFNFGRILSAAPVLTTGALLSYFQADYAAIGRITSLIFAVGMVVIWLAPDTTHRSLDE